MTTKRNKKKIIDVSNAVIPEMDPKEELQQKLEKMIEDREKKCIAAKTQLVDMLDVTASKYFTATGVAEALRVLRFTSGEEDVEITSARLLASRMAGTAMNMKEKAEKLAAYEMDQLCHGFYTEDVTGVMDLSFKDLAYEMMCIDLCRNVGGAAEDMVEFCKRVDEEIEATKKAIEDLEKEEPEEEE